MTEVVFLNDRLVNTDEASISAHDAGFLHGVGLFETMRSYKGTVFRLEDHIDRLLGSAQALQIPLSQTRSEMIMAVMSVMDANHLREARLRLTASRGSLRQVGPDSTPMSTLLVTGTPLEPYPPELYAKGMTAAITDYKQNPFDPTAGHKTTNYLPRLLALQQAKAKGAGEALWFTTSNYLAEGSISNVFIVFDGKLLTPPLTTPVLPGIARKVVMELAQQHHIKCLEQPLVIKELLGASEVFITNSIMELMPVCRVERHSVGDERPGPIYKQLHDLYRQTVTESCA